MIKTCLFFSLTFLSVSAMNIELTQIEKDQNLKNTDERVSIQKLYQEIPELARNNLNVISGNLESRIPINSGEWQPLISVHEDSRCKDLQDRLNLCVCMGITIIGTIYLLSRYGQYLND